MSEGCVEWCSVGWEGEDDREVEEKMSERELSGGVGGGVEGWVGGGMVYE